MTDVFEPMLIAGSDGRLESEIGAGRDEVLHFKAPETESRLAVYGPYASLPAGRYRLELQFSLSERASGEISVELCHRKAALTIYRRPVFAWEVERGFIRISYPFEQPVQDLELRLRVPPHCEGSIRQLSIGRVPDDRSTGP
jgi:hypothetical protein